MPVEQLQRGPKLLSCNRELLLSWRQQGNLN
uniref:Uncharacterized protein n=1 Tax=Rhizophora mucronata TaxID=61149 RepID=A0A2P2NDQ6_RHIMU